MQSTITRGLKVSERDGYVTVIVDVKGSTFEVTKAEYKKFLELRTRKQDRGLSKEIRMTARTRYDDTLKGWHVRRKDSEKPRRNRRKDLKETLDMTGTGTSGQEAPPIDPTPLSQVDNGIESNQPALVADKTKPRTQRGAIVSSRPGFHTIIVDSSGNILEVPEDDYNRWLSLHKAKTDVETSRDSRLVNRARAKNMMDNWGRKGKQKKRPEPPRLKLSTMKQPETEEECYIASMSLLGSAFIS